MMNRTESRQKVSIVIPVYNRRETTLRCLKVLREQGIFAWAQIWVVDDGSSDGTSEAIREAHAEVKLLLGDGGLWWSQAICLGMEAAMQDGADFVVWLNDDCTPRPGALSRLVKVSAERQAVTTAPCELRETGALHYGGFIKKKSGLQMLQALPGECVPCDSVCGNCVCIPRAVVKKVGLVDAAVFPHMWGDADYGLRVKAAGFPLFVVGDAVCDSTYGSAKNRQSWLLGDMSVRELWRLCLHPQSGSLALPSWKFRLRHWSLTGCFEMVGSLMKLVAVSGVRLAFRKQWLRRWFGGRSATHQQIQKIKAWEAGERD
jgi:GT2 family glycosyltransferase